MSAPKHTPGPWQVKSDYEPTIVIGNVDGEIIDSTAHYTYDFVCDTLGDDDSRSPAIAEANARLIAAAPELLEALNTLAGQVGKLRISQPPALAEAYFAARDVIVKATGQ